MRALINKTNQICTENKATHYSTPIFYAPKLISKVLELIPSVRKLWTHFLLSPKAKSKKGLHSGP